MSYRVVLLALFLVALAAVGGSVIWGVVTMRGYRLATVVILVSALLALAGAGVIWGS